MEEYKRSLSNKLRAIGLVAAATLSALYSSRDEDDEYNIQNAASPKVSDDGDRWAAKGQTSRGTDYGASFIGGENPFDDPAKYKTIEDALLGDIGRAAEISEVNVALVNSMGRVAKHGVIVASEDILVTPLPGVEVVRVGRKPLER